MKVDYSKQPFRVCRWNRKLRMPTDPNELCRPTKELPYYCDDAECKVNATICMKCFCDIDVPEDFQGYEDHDVPEQFKWMNKS